MRMQPILAEAGAIAAKPKKGVRLMDWSINGLIMNALDAHGAPSRTRARANCHSLSAMDVVLLATRRKRRVVVAVACAGRMATETLP